MFTLKPDKPKNIPKLPEGNSDIVRPAAAELSLDAPFGIPEKAITVLRVKTGHFTLNASINTLRKADRLVVTFMGARPGGHDPVNSQRPMFARRQWDVLFDAPILAISDPVTEVEWQSNDARTGFYMGTFEHDLVPEILLLIDKVCDELGIGRDKVVLYGAASGGTAALLIGARRREGTGVIAVSPYLRPDKYREQLVANAIKLMGGTEDDWARMGEETPWRNNPLTALRDGLNDGNELRVVLAQNLKDRTTINRHFPGLWRRFDIDPDGGASQDGRVITLLFDCADSTNGHESGKYAAPLVRRAYEIFDNPLVVPPKKIRKIAKSRPDAEASGKPAEAPDDPAGDPAGDDFGLY